MAKSLGIAWECETCGCIDYGRDAMPWSCPLCGVETCNHCLDRYSVCKGCGKGKTDEELIALTKWEE